MDNLQSQSRRSEKGCTNHTLCNLIFTKKSSGFDFDSKPLLRANLTAEIAALFLLPHKVNL